MVIRKIFFISFLLHSVSSFADILSPEELRDEFGNYPNFHLYEKLNKEIDIGDYTFCEFDRGDDLCLLGLQREKYAVDIKNPDAMEIVWKENEKGELVPDRLKSLSKVEHELLSHFGLLVSQKILQFNIGRVEGNYVTESFSSIQPNGCGTPESWTHAYIPDAPF
ncbi:hypothetical protein P2G88_01620 [Aliiglaciecola sp. CAU 1673]|uniref:hypothetical protein n=1 Tax=Aliiglaciecola sp. CAU 1673 TaxID=3032595 RepID=UPI0023DC920B|nr:hypothetical protein [Aliiglaciecola sp. CAU 1673]MDF2176951.1 hypothetical protein [Aliiglaciecola sp. CAU 1673]